MAYMKRAADGTVPAGIHMITFVADEPTWVPDDEAIIEACRVAGCAMCEEGEVPAGGEETAEQPQAASRAAAKKPAAKTAG